MAAIVCDDHPLVRRALALLMTDLTGPDVSAASDFAEAWELAEARDDIEICVVDLHMPGMSPAEGISGLKHRAPRAKFVVVTGSDSDAELMDTLAMGIDGYVPKTVEPGIVEAAIRLVLAGGRYLPERLAELTPGNGPEPAAAPAACRQPVETAYGKLGQRHLDVLDQLERGRSNKEIARLLGLSPATVKTHLAHIFAVLGVSNRTEAALHARAYQ